MTALLFGLLAGLMMGVGMYCAARYTGWEWFSRRFQADADYIHATFEKMFWNVPIAKCRLIVLALPSFGLALATWATWGIQWYGTLFLALAAAGICWRLLRNGVDYLYTRYVRRFDEQLVDALVMASNALRVGMSLPQALDIVTKEMPQPVSQEFGLALKEHRMGKTLDDALGAMADRLPSLDLAIVVNAVLILRETGGNLSETFDTIVYTITEREKVKDKIRTLTAQGKAQGVILISMPFVMAYLMNLVNPEYMEPMFTTLLGWLLLLFMCLMLLAGGLLIRKIITIDV